MNDIEQQLIHAIANGNLEEVRKLLEAGASPDGVDPERWTPLMIAAEHENFEAINILLSFGADINKSDNYGQTPLYIAVDISIDGTIQSGGKQGDEPTETILYLLEHGADLDAKNHNGKTPLDLAQSYQSQKIIKFLSEYIRLNR
jgi:ankyrin repeat protein